MSLTFEQAVDLQHSYKPNDITTVEQLGTIPFAPLVGPTAVGKNHAMAELAEKRGYHQVGSLVNRELRPNDPPNVLHRDDNELLQLIEEGRLVQFAALLGNRAIYASEIENYQPGKINIKDIFAHSIDSFTGYGFKCVRPVCIVVPPDEWEPRLDERFKSLDNIQKRSRLDEAEQSVEWILHGSPEVRRVVIIGNVDHAQEGIERVKAFVELNQDVPVEQIHYDVAEEMIGSLPRLRKKYLGES